MYGIYIIIIIKCCYTNFNRYYIGDCNGMMLPNKIGMYEYIINAGIVQHVLSYLHTDPTSSNLQKTTVVKVEQTKQELFINNISNMLFFLNTLTYTTKMSIKYNSIRIIGTHFLITMESSHEGIFYT